MDLATITTTIEVGSWSITNAPTNSTATITNGTFNGNGSPGGEYELTFTLSEVPPVGCPSSATEIITISEVVTAGTITDTIRICNDGSEVNLLEVLQGETLGGIWTDVSINPAVGFFNEGILTTENLPSGIYNFVYEVAANAPCANDSEEIIVEIDTPVEAGILLQNLEVCEGEDAVLNLFDSIEGYDVGGTWVDVSVSPANGFDVVGELNTSALTVGSYAFSYQVNSNGICANDELIVAVNFNETPISDAGETSVLTCNEPTAVIGGSASSVGENMAYLWSGSVEDSTAAVTIANLSGTYTLTVTDTETGCSATDEVTITQEGAIPILSAAAFGLSCFGANDGRIEVEGVTSGVEPFQYSLDGGELTNEMVFEGLAAGSHTLEVVDANGCTDVLTFDITEPEELTIILDLNTASNTIQLGDSVQIMPSFSGAFLTFDWMPLEAFEPCDLVLDSVACLNPWVQPTENITYTLLIGDAMGCTAAESIEVLVESQAKVVFPTAFSPNDDGINDEFRLFANDNAIRVQSFVVFNRWGEKVFERLDFDPNDGSVFWDGTYQSKEMEVGVFVYYAVVEFRDGSVDLFQGNLTLVR